MVSKQKKIRLINKDIETARQTLETLVLMNEMLCHLQRRCELRDYLKNIAARIICEIRDEDDWIDQLMITRAHIKGEKVDPSYDFYEILDMLEKGYLTREELD